jgi:sortase (surface protein transpeptidase)
MRRRVAAVLVIAGLSFGWLSLAFVPTFRPPTPTNELYASIRPEFAPAGAAPESRPPSILDHAVARPAPTPAPLAAIERLKLPSIGVDAGVVSLNLTSTGAMDSPRDPVTVGWYDFTAKPGLGGNAVLSGHVDYRDHGPAVFWNLRNVQPGDPISIVLKDGMRLDYIVTGLQSFPVSSMPVAEIIAPTPVESLTIITCSGSFQSGRYSDRLVVRAMRVFPDAR